MRNLMLLAALAACASDPPPPPRAPDVQAVDAAPALAALRAGQFTDAARAASVVLAREPRDSQVAAVRAVATYVGAADRLASELEAVIKGADAVHYFDHEEGRAVWTRFLAELEDVDRDLAVAAADPQFVLELCPACWTGHDWNHNGRLDPGDEHLFEIETDLAGSDLPERDARRRPTYRFDAGDIQWARAMIAFQKAGAELVLAYRWSELDKLFLRKSDARGDQRVVIHLIDADRVKHAREDILAGLAFSAAEREAYLAETDDDREWVPSPRQVNHPMPFTVDQALYTHWADLLGDANKLLTSDEGVSLREAAEVIDAHAGRLVPAAYVDIGRMLRDPEDIVIDLGALDQRVPPLERIARELLGHGYAEHMRASPLVGRIRHMLVDAQTSDETLEHKLHYLFWLN